MLRQKSLWFLTNKQKGKAVGCQLKNKCLQDWVNCQPIVCYICITYSSQFGTATILVLYWWCGEETTIESGKLETWDPKNDTSWTSSDPNDLGWFNLHVICVKEKSSWTPDVLLWTPSVPGFPLTFLQARAWKIYLSLNVWDRLATISNKAFFRNQF